MSILTRLWQSINKRTLVVAMITPVALFLVLGELPYWIWKYESPIDMFLLLTLFEHYFIGHHLGLDWTFIDFGGGGFLPIIISPPILLLTAVLNCVAVVVLFYVIFRIGIRIDYLIRGRSV